jgi:hypothetical protein
LVSINRVNTQSAESMISHPVHDCLVQYRCYEDKITQQILAKVENITGIPEKNSEFIQLLRYEEGQLYNTHHDYGKID